MVKKYNPKSLGVPTKAYSQGVVIPVGDAELMFVTGQLSQDINGNVISPNNTEEQTKVVFSRINDILKEANMTFDHVVKAQIFIKDISQSKVVSAIRDEIFKNSRPASTLIEVSGFVKDGCMIEIEVTAVKTKSILTSV